MRLSVIIPSLRGDVPQSLLAQVAGRADVELVVVKGVSPVGKARNEGLARATGDYIAWVDADDEVTGDWLDEILLATDAKPDVVVVGHAWMLGGTDGRVTVWQGEDLLGDVLTQRILRSEMWNFVVRRELWDGISFDATARTLEDWEVAPQLLARVRTVGRIGKPLYRYRVCCGSLTHQVDEPMQREILERAVVRLSEVKRLGLWEKYGRIALGGVGYVVYCCAEDLTLSGRGLCPTARAAVRWIRRHLVQLLMTPTPRTFKAKWLLASLRAWWVVRWYYGRGRGAG